MDYMARHGAARARPADLVPGTVRVITARMNYWPGDARRCRRRARRSERPRTSRATRWAATTTRCCARGCSSSATRIAGEVGEFGYRVFTDSAPVLEVALAAKAGLGWRGKHTLLLTRDMGSYFFLGEIYTDLPLPVTDAAVATTAAPAPRASARVPTGAIVAPYELDARRCISYLTIELPGAIPEELRPLIGNRVYGCDDCQLACPWNRFAQVTGERDFDAVRHGLDRASLVELFAWTEAEFDTRMRGSAIRRIGYERWSRNLAVGLGNAPRSADSRRGARSAAPTTRRRSCASTWRGRSRGSGDRTSDQ